ncbi:MAG: serine/threonine-protein kinase [Planctomycetota bacterium]
MENTYVGPFLILKRLGTNRRQRVFHARQTKQDRDVALKFIKPPPDVEWRVALSKIERETEVLKGLRHPNLIRVYGAGAHEEQIFFANELIKGESLAAILSRRGKLAPDAAVDIGLQIASLLDYLHDQDIVHSKLTPEKILITKDHQVKVADLRLNRSRKRRWDQPRRRDVELAAYMAPEQFTEGASPKSDFYSLGVILYEMLTGKLPYPPDTIGRMTRKKLDNPVPSVARHVMNCPIWLDKIVTQMLQPKVRLRPHSAQAIVFAFNEIKKIDHGRKAAVAQVAGNFNPLTAGTDKTEANRLLGRKERNRNEPDTPFYQRVPFLLFALIVIATILVVAILPTSDQKLMDRAKAMIEQGELSEAREELMLIMERNNDPELAKEAEELYYATRKSTLIRQAQTGSPLRFPQNPEARAYCDAVVLQQEGNYAEAREMFEQLVSTVDAAGDQRHVYFAAASALEQLEHIAPEIPTDPVELMALIDSYEGTTDEEILKEAEKKLAEIILNFGGREEYEEVVERANGRLRVVKAFLYDETQESLEAELDEAPVVETPESADSDDGE